MRWARTIVEVKPWQRTTLRIVLSVAMLGVLAWRLPDVRWSDVVPDWGASTPWWLAGAALATLAAYGFQTLRWSYVLDAFGLELPFGRLLSHFFAGQFVSNVLPTAFGGDVVRISRTGTDLSDNATAFASVTIERLAGWLVLPVISAGAISAQPSLRHARRATDTALAIGAVTLVALVAVLGVASSGAWEHRARSATGWRRFLAAVHVGAIALRRRPAQAVRVVGAGLVFQLLLCLSVWMLARGTGVTAVTLGASLAFFPVAAIVQNLPIGLGGLGVREGAFVLFFGALGATNGQAIGLGLAVYLLTVATSALGAPFFAAGPRRGLAGGGTDASPVHDPGAGGDARSGSPSA